jgi:hypothetical protein
MSGGEIWIAIDKELVTKEKYALSQLSNRYFASRSLLRGMW